MSEEFIIDDFKSFEGDNQQNMDVLHSLLCNSKEFNSKNCVQKKGFLKLLQGDKEWEGLFEKVINRDKTNHLLFFEQGMILYQYGIVTKNKKYCVSANKKFKNATKLKEDHFLSWYHWGNNLFHMGTNYNNQLYLNRSLVLLLKALSHIEGLTNKESQEIFWKIGKVYFQLYNHSGEISELSKAIEMFKKQTTQFKKHLRARTFTDLGIAYTILGNQINSINCYKKAAEYYQQVLSRDASNKEIWVKLGKLLYLIYNCTMDTDYFDQSKECFQNALKLDSGNPKIYLRWANILYKYAKQNKDVKALQEALLVCEKSHTLDSKQEDVAILKVNILVCLGWLTSRLDILLHGKQEVEKSLKTFKESNRLLTGQGLILKELGKYYKDVKYYKQALDKFKKAISLKKNNYHIFVHLGDTYASLAKLEENASFYLKERACLVKARKKTQSIVALYKSGLNALNLYNAYKCPESLENSVMFFEQACELQKNQTHYFPEVLVYYAVSLDTMGDMLQEEKCYKNAIEILKHSLVLSGDNNHLEIHYKIANTYTHLAEASEDVEIYKKALYYYQIAYQNNKENSQILLDWAISLMNLSEIITEEDIRKSLLDKAEHKLILSAKCGNVEVYYHLGCLYSLTENYKKSIEALERAKMFMALPKLEDVLGDYWLSNLRDTELFKYFINNLKA